jgi:hypothetical protein
MGSDAFADPLGTPSNSLTSVDEEPHHHHHHHHRHHEEEAIQQEEPQYPQVAIVPQSAPIAGVESLDPHPSLSAADKKALQDLVAALSTKESDVKQLLQEALVSKGLAPTQADSIVQTMKEVSQSKVEAAAPAQETNVVPTVEAPKAAETLVFAKVAVQAPNPAGNTRPAAPVTTSHIEKAPKASDFVPESVYVQQQVPFVEKPQMPVKHVAKRILIPRMEEPGPVIGGGSRPLHIQIPFPDNEPLSISTRPSAPSHLWSSITTAKDTPAAKDTTTAISIGAEKAVSSQVPSVKPSTIAAANDEALSAPEVVIF